MPENGIRVPRPYGKREVKMNNIRDENKKSKMKKSEVKDRCRVNYNAF